MKLFENLKSSYWILLQILLILYNILNQNHLENVRIFAIVYDKIQEEFHLHF